MTKPERDLVELRVSPSGVSAWVDGRKLSAFVAFEGEFVVVRLLRNQIKSPATSESDAIATLMPRLLDYQRDGGKITL